MKPDWGRKETVVWPPHVPIYTYSAVAFALLCTIFFCWERLRFQQTPLQRTYAGAFARAAAGAMASTKGKYALLYVDGPKKPSRLAVGLDFIDGETRLPSGKIAPAALSSLAQADGRTAFHTAPEQAYQDASIYRWMSAAVFDGRSFVGTYAVSLGEGAFVLILALAFAAPQDLKRFRELKYGRRLKGPVMNTPAEFNRRVKGGGIGFQTTETKKLMRVPLRNEAQHFQIIGDTGVGKTTLIMQMLQQIRQRGETAVVYDPAGEYVQRFYDPSRGDHILNPLDKRGPYWGPAEEMLRNAEADAIAASLYQPTAATKDEFFHETPAQIFAHLLKQGPTPQQLAAWMADAAEIESRVAGTEMEFYIGQKAGPQRAGVLSSLGLVAKSLRLLPTREETEGKVWSATDWAAERKGWVFITSRPSERVALRPLHSLWIDLLILRLLSKPEAGQKKVWFVIDFFFIVKWITEIYTAITENRKSGNPIVLGFQGKAQVDYIYDRLAEVMMSQPATKIFMKTSEPNAAEWVSKAIGSVEIERLRETKFDGSRSGRNFVQDRQVEPLVMNSEIAGLTEKHAYLKLGNNVARFAFDYIDFPILHPAFVPRVADDEGLAFDRKTLKPKPKTSPQPSQPPAAQTAGREEQAEESSTGPARETIGKGVF